MKKLNKIISILTDENVYRMLKNNQTDRFIFENAIMEEVFEKAQLLKKIIVNKEIGHLFPKLNNAIQRFKKRDYIANVLNAHGIEWFYDFEDDIAFIKNDISCKVKLTIVDPLYKYTIEKGAYSVFTGNDFIEILNRLLKDLEEDKIEAVLEEDHYATHENATA